MTSNFYEILGVDKNASIAEIRKEYHKLALKYHPDKNKDADQEIFKKINEAFDNLSDEKKKRDYDMKLQFPHNANVGGGGFPNFPFNFFNFSQTSNLKKQDHFYTYKITLNDVFMGKTATFNITRKMLCQNCVSKCSSCQGQGVVKNIVRLGNIMQFMDKHCDICSGKGVQFTKNCDSCHSTSFTQKDKTIHLIIPKGVEHGKKYLYKEWGEQPTKLIEQPGDFYIVIEVENHPHLIRRDLDLIYNIQIKLAESIIGKQITIPHFTEHLDININQFGIINPNKEHIIMDKGLENEYGKKGNLVIKIDIIYPIINFSESDIKKLHDVFQEVKL